MLQTCPYSSPTPSLTGHGRTGSPRNYGPPVMLSTYTSHVPTSHIGYSPRPPDRTPCWPCSPLNTRQPRVTGSDSSPRPVTASSCSASTPPARPGRCAACRAGVCTIWTRKGYGNCCSTCSRKFAATRRFETASTLECRPDGHSKTFLSRLATGRPGARRRTAPPPPGFRPHYPRTARQNRTSPSRHPSGRVQPGNTYDCSATDESAGRPRRCHHGTAEERPDSAEQGGC